MLAHLDAGCPRKSSRLGAAACRNRPIIKFLAVLSLDYGPRLWGGVASKQMFESLFEFSRQISGLGLFALGAALFARAGAYAEPALRGRLLALSAFGFFTAAAIWCSDFALVAEIVPAQFETAFYVPGFLALYYFSFGWNEARPGLAHGAVAATLCVLALVPFGIADAALFPLVVQYGVALPALSCAAIVLFRGAVVPLSAPSPAAPIGALGMAGLGLLSVIADPAGNAAGFVPAAYAGPVGFAANIAACLLVLIVAASMLALLNRFDEERTSASEKRLEEAEAILAKGEARLNRALGFAGVGSWEWDAASDEVRWSDQMYRVHGYAVREFPASFSSLLDSVHAEDRAAVEQAVLRALERSVSYDIDYRVVWPDQSIRFVRAHCDVEAGPGGGAARLIGTLNDITDLSEAKLAAEGARAAAEAASVAKSNFIANVSHELRTPLNAVIGFSEILEKEILGVHSNPLYKTYATDITKAGKHLLAVINDILTVSRYEAGQMHLEEDAAINVEELIKKCARWVDGQAAQGEVSLRVDVAPNLPSLRGDPRLLVQAVLNLLSNAVKFTPRQGFVEIGAEENRLGGITIRVTDTGIGMTEEQIARIGEPFLQFDDARSRKYEGTGLGLRIAKQILTLHAAEMEIHSTPGQGTTFQVNLPPGRSVRQKAQRLRLWG